MEIFVLIVSTLSALWIGTRIGLRYGAHRGLCMTIAALSILHEEDEEEYNRLVSGIAKVMVTRKDDVKARADLIEKLVPAR